MENLKEYLRKNSNGTYSYIGTVRPEHVSDFMIEIPKTAELVLRNKQGKIEFFKDKCGSKFENGNWIGVSIPFARLQEGRILFLKGGCQAYWDSDFSKTLAAPFNLIESRHTHPEELPFIDDEPKITTAKGSELDYIAKIHDMRDRYDGESDEDYRYQLEHYISRKEPSLNDQYAEIETVRKKTRENNHYFIDVSDVDEVDFYEIAKRYNVTDPAIQHILKKCLAIGNRGHKDLETDLMDILKTAKRALRINGFGEPK